MSESKKLILIIDDDPNFFSIYSDYFTRKGYAVDGALEGKTGLDKAREKKPDIILLDMILPGMSGAEILKALRDDGALQDIPVIVLTNSEDENSVAEALELGCPNYLIKTSQNLNDIEAKILEIISQSKG